MKVSDEDVIGDANTAPADTTDAPVVRSRPVRWMWFGVGWVAVIIYMHRNQGKPFTKTLSKLEYVFEGVMGAVIIAVAVKSLATGSPIEPTWFGATARRAIRWTSGVLAPEHANRLRTLDVFDRLDESGDGRVVDRAAGEVDAGGEDRLAEEDQLARHMRIGRGDELRQEGHEEQDDLRVAEIDQGALGEALPEAARRDPDGVCRGAQRGL